MKLSTRIKGEVAQLKVQLIAAQKNLFCSLPTNGASVYDLILDDGKGKIDRAQIKYCTRKHKNQLQLNLQHPNTDRKYYTKDNFDLLLVYLPSQDSVIAYGPKKFHKKSMIQINLTNPDSKHYWKKYIW